MKTRIISGAVLVVIALAAILLGGPVLLLTLLFCSVVGMYEMYQALGVMPDKKAFTAPAIGGFVCAVLYYALIFIRNGQGFGETAAAGVIIIMACYVLTFPKYTSDQAISACFGFFYIAFMLSFIYLIRIEENGIRSVWLVFLASWVADTGAYFTGMKFGKHKMAPVLSPKKTIEGAVGGVLSAALAGVLFSVILEGHEHVWQYALICAAGSLISMAGDLAASAIKRDKKIKDYGNLIPGHGGIMDRFDSVIFTAPIIYLLTQLLISGGM